MIEDCLEGKDSVVKGDRREGVVSQFKRDEKSQPTVTGELLRWIAQLGAGASRGGLRGSQAREWQGRYMRRVGRIHQFPLFHSIDDKNVATFEFKQRIAPLSSSHSPDATPHSEFSRPPVSTNQLAFMLTEMHPMDGIFSFNASPPTACSFSCCPAAITTNGCAYS